MLHRKLVLFASVIFACAWLLLWLLGGPPNARANSNAVPSALDPAPPASTQRLVFIHHSTGGAWLWDGLRTQLNNNNYYVTETNYGWGPDSIGDTTDIGHWYDWFVGPHRDTYMNALYNNDIAEGENTVADPGGENNIIMFKSCFPNSYIGGSPKDPPTTGDNPLRGQSAGSEHHTVANIKGIYNDLLPYFATRQDKLFIVITAPPLQRGSTDAAHAANARAVNQWLVNDWLAGYPHNNIAVFDYFNVLTSNGGNPNTNDYDWETGNHHRYRSSSIQYITNQGSNFSAYPSGDGDDHPTGAGHRKAAREFAILLNIWVHRWQETPGGTPTVTPTPTETPVCSGAPAQPVLVAPGNNNTTSKVRPVLKWNASLCATSYSVTVKDAATGRKVDQATTGNQQYKPDALARGKTYKWFVQACTADHACAKSAIWRLTIR